MGKIIITPIMPQKIILISERKIPPSFSTEIFIAFKTSVPGRRNTVAKNLRNAMIYPLIRKLFAYYIDLFIKRSSLKIKDVKNREYNDIF